MKAFPRTDRLLEDSIVPPASDRRDDEEKERYLTRQLWWALIGLILFALVMFLGWGGAHAATGADASMFAPTPHLAEALERARLAPASPDRERPDGRLNYTALGISRR
ncbi:MAG TPA: hypothetical protein VJ673_08415 [Aromatoleum sp.]|uniref:hypothetical protein n=1 Tax=Aromatoleum sp. TaxID=2307007 RepID=UPI002B48A65A|nr:hypothetical protein [Aromatoleum sp.]HJV25697.1 hypothetical protein [Aromatoleum sp.]